MGLSIFEGFWPFFGIYERVGCEQLFLHLEVCWKKVPNPTFAESPILRPFKERWQALMWKKAMVLEADPERRISGRRFGFWMRLVRRGEKG